MILEIEAGGGAAVRGDEGADPVAEPGEVGRTNWMRRPLTGETEMPGACGSAGRCSRSGVGLLARRELAESDLRLSIAAPLSKSEDGRSGRDSEPAVGVGFVSRPLLGDRLRVKSAAEFGRKSWLSFLTRKTSSTTSSAPTTREGPAFDKEPRGGESWGTWDISAMSSPKAGSSGVRSLMFIGELSTPVDERELGPGVPER